MLPLNRRMTTSVSVLAVVTGGGLVSASAAPTLARATCESFIYRPSATASRPVAGKSAAEVGS